MNITYEDSKNAKKIQQEVGDMGFEISLNKKDCKCTYVSTCREGRNLMIKIFTRHHV